MNIDQYNTSSPPTPTSPPPPYPQQKTPPYKFSLGPSALTNSAPAPTNQYHHHHRLVNTLYSTIATTTATTTSTIRASQLEKYKMVVPVDSISSRIEQCVGNSKERSNTHSSTLSGSILLIDQPKSSIARSKTDASHHPSPIHLLACGCIKSYRCINIGDPNKPQSHPKGEGESLREGAGTGCTALSCNLRSIQL